MSISIYNKEDLKNIENDMSADYHLENDIDLEGENFEPIGYKVDNDHVFFKGNLDGNGHKIYNGKIIFPNSDFIGIIAVAENNTIKNVSVESLYVVGRDVVGILIGTTGGDPEEEIEAEVINCSVKGEVKGREYIGLLTGGNLGEIKDSYATGKVKGDDWVGGLVGYNGSQVEAHIENCYFKGHVTGGEYVGGLVSVQDAGSTIEKCYTEAIVLGKVPGGLISMNYSGNIYESFSTGSVRAEGESCVAGGFVSVAHMAEEGLAEIHDCYSTASVSSEWQAGGFMGQGDGHFYNCYAVGVVHGEGEGVAGFAAAIADTEIENSYSFSNCYYDKERTGQSIGAYLHDWHEDIYEIIEEEEGVLEGKNTNEMLQQDTFDEWDFDNIWSITEETTYPFLQWQEEPIKNNSPNYEPGGEINFWNGTEWKKISSINNANNSSFNEAIKGYYANLHLKWVEFWNAIPDIPSVPVYKVYPEHAIEDVNTLIDEVEDGSVIYFTEGEYVLDDSIKVERSNIYLKGVKGLTTLKCDFVDDDKGVIHIEGDGEEKENRIENILVEGFTVDGNRENDKESYGIYGEYVGYAHSTGDNGYDSSTTGNSEDNKIGVVIRSCVVEQNSSQGIRLWSGTANNKIENCIIQNNDSRGIYDWGSNNTITGNTCQNNDGDGIHNWGGSSTITGNTAQSNGNRGISNSANGVTITGNTSQNNDSIGIHSNGSNSTITGNTSQNNNEDGIYNAGHNSTVIGNTSQNNNNDGVYNAGNEVTIIGNISQNNDNHGIYNCGEEGITETYGENCIIASNIMKDNSTNYEDTGDGTKKIHNQEL